MSDWRNYLTDNEPKSSKKKISRSGCKRNKINKNRYGPCSFNDQDQCVHCNRPRKKVLRLDPITNTIIVEYFE